MNYPDGIGKPDPKDPKYAGRINAYTKDAMEWDGMRRYCEIAAGMPPAPLPDDDIGPVTVTAVLAVAGAMDANGDTHTEESLRAAADGVTRFYDAQHKHLVYRGPIPPSRPTATDGPTPGV